MGQIQTTAAALIAAGQSLSNGLNLGSKVVCLIQMPAAWTAADITFQCSVDNGATWADLLDSSGSEIAITAPSAGQLLSMDPSQFAGVVFLKVRSGHSAAAVNQVAAASVIIVSRKFYANN
jgi:hypothetical protein